MRSLGNFINIIPVSFMVEVSMLMFLGCATIACFNKGHYGEFVCLLVFSYFYVPNMESVEYHFSRGSTTWKMALLAMGLSVFVGFLSR